MDRFDRTTIDPPARARWASRWRRALGEVLYYFSEPAIAMDRLERSAYVHKARSPGSRLTEAEVKELASFMFDVQERESRRAYFAGRPIEQTFQGLLIPLVDRLIAARPQVRSVMNVGAHFAYCDHVLAERHPGVSFVGVDFAPNLREFNAEFVRGNLDFRTGYALDLLESGEIKPDVVTMSSTATVIKNAEVKRYLEVVAKSGGYVVFNEPLYNLPGDGVIDPAEVSTAESVPAFQYEMPNGLPGPLCYTHNYKGLAAEAGLEVLYYRAFRPPFTDLRMVQLIAGKPGQGTLA